MTDKEAMTDRERIEAWWFGPVKIDKEVDELVAILAVVRAEAREQALEEAARVCDDVISQFKQGTISAATWTARAAAGRIRSLKGEVK